jgi:tetraacyldisaccharide 4'-kinase
MPEDSRLVWQRRLVPVLAPASWLYGAAVRARRLAYARGLLPTVRVDCPVISVGSLVAGGTGKTPMTAYVARRFGEHRVAVLSRGYGGSYKGRHQVTRDTPASWAGDEPVLLTRTCAADVWVSRDRARLAQALADRYDLFVLDDGYQHVRLERFLNLCLLPAEAPGRLLPAGLWREAPSALSAADLLVALDQWPDWIGEWYEGPRIIVQLRQGPWQGPDGASEPRGPVFAFCGVARPERFLGSLGALDVRGSLTWPDHHAYTPDDLRLLLREARGQGAEALVTTAKDAVRLSPTGLGLPLYWCDLDVHFLEGERDFATVLDSVALPPRS